jgi:hypothetical protein
MKQYTIAIPEDKEAFFQEFMRMAGIFVIDSGNTDIPKWHKDIIRERVASSSDTNMLNWDDVKNKIKVK